MKKYASLLSTIVLTILSLLTLSISSYLLFFYEVEDTVEVGMVDSAVKVYFFGQDPEENIYYVVENDQNESFEKTGVVRIGLSDPDDPQFVKNLRADVIVNSNVDTFIRIAPFEQLTLTYTVNGITREIALTQDDYFRLNYNFDKFYDNRSVDGYLYFKYKIKKSSTVSIVIPLIKEYFVDEEFFLYEDNYSLQFGFIIETVQAVDGPLNNWGQSKTPWGEDWSNVWAMNLHICGNCEYMYDSTIGDESQQIPPFTDFEDLPSDWKCPICENSKNGFHLLT
ncbi:MAG: rubredoxin [Bacilli bacterium]